MQEYLNANQKHADDILSSQKELAKKLEEKHKSLDFKSVTVSYPSPFYDTYKYFHKSVKGKNGKETKLFYRKKLDENEASKGSDGDDDEKDKVSKGLEGDDEKDKEKWELLLNELDVCTSLSSEDPSKCFVRYVVASDDHEYISYVVKIGGTTSVLYSFRRTRTRFA